MARKDIARRSESRSRLPVLRPERGGPFMALQQEMNRLFDRFFGREMEPFYPMEELGFPTAYPQMDVKETDKSIKIAVELPGMDEKDIQVSISGNSLTIKGEKKEEKEEREGSYIRMERRYGSFNRVVPLPDEVDRDKAEASFKNGLLEIELPKTKDAAAQKKKIEIKAH